MENLIAPKPKRLSAANHDELTKLLLAKDGELQSALSLAGEQGEIEKKIRGVQEELERQDAHIGQLQKQLKDAETLLSTSIYQVQDTLHMLDMMHFKLNVHFFVASICKTNYNRNVCSPGKAEAIVDREGEEDAGAGRRPDQVRSPDQRVERGVGAAQLAAGRPPQAVPDRHRDATRLPRASGVRHRGRAAAAAAGGRAAATGGDGGGRGGCGEV